MDGEAHHFVLRDGLSPAQQDIVSHAAVLFGQFGYTKTNIGEIAERVGMSPGNLYRYYRNKQAIGEEVVRCYLTHSEQVMEDSLAALPSADAEVRLKAMFASGIGNLLIALADTPRMVELAGMICASDSGILTAHLDWKKGTFERLLREGVDAGIWRVDDPVAMAETVLDASRGFWDPVAVAQLDPARVPSRVTGVLDALIAGWRI